MRDIVVLARQFATMIQAGLPLVQSLGVLAEQTGNRRLAAVVGEVRYDVESGRTLAGALGEHPAVFNQLFVSMVSAGEAGGVLDTVLARLADSLEKTDRLVRKVRGAMVYPAVVLAVSALARISHTSRLAVVGRATWLAVASGGAIMRRNIGPS